MPLKPYQDKRNFASSPEPPGDEVKPRRRRKKKPPFFCVHKHLASHLHYDLRLEHNTVLLSWAVPKGPSLDPTIKRFAAHVEDHPLEYGTFEGVIPTGYGAGVVMLWDSGTWTPESPDVDAALAKGDLDITEFAPLSVKSEDDFPAIVAAQAPSLWVGNQRSASSPTGAMLQTVIEQAAELRLAELQRHTPRGPRVRKPRT
ncbi:MAG: hypothetical protein HQ485_05565 [Acidobacteria bacterium]|nr:hypothetical protein [Acidobacteriota bacterium]